MEEVKKREKELMSQSASQQDLSDVPTDTIEVWNVID